MKYRMTYTISSPVKGEGAVQSSGKFPNIILFTPTQKRLKKIPPPAAVETPDPIPRRRGVGQTRKRVCESWETGVLT